MFIWNSNKQQNITPLILLNSIEINHNLLLCAVMSFYSDQLERIWNELVMRTFWGLSLRSQKPELTEEWMLTWVTVSHHQQSWQYEKACHHQSLWPWKEKGFVSTVILKLKTLLLHTESSLQVTNEYETSGFGDFLLARIMPMPHRSLRGVTLKPSSTRLWEDCWTPYGKMKN